MRYTIINTINKKFFPTAEKYRPLKLDKICNPVLYTNKKCNKFNKKYIDHVSDNLSQNLKDYYKYKYNARRKI